MTDTPADLPPTFGAMRADERHADDPAAWAAARQLILGPDRDRLEARVDRIDDRVSTIESVLDGDDGDDDGPVDITETLATVIRLFDGVAVVALVASSVLRQRHRYTAAAVAAYFAGAFAGSSVVLSGRLYDAIEDLARARRT